MNHRNRLPYLRLILAAGLFALALLGGVTAQEKNDEEAKIAKLIEQLGDDEYDVRKAAEKKLIAIGEPALDQVKAAAKGAADADVKLRAIVLSATISKGLYGQIRTFAGHTTDIRSLAVSKDGKRMLSGGYKDPNMILWDIDTGKEVRKFEGKGWVWSVAFSPDQKKALSSGGVDPTMHLWNIADGKEERQFTGNTSYVYGAAFSPDGKHVAASGAKDDCSIRIYETDTGKEVHKLEGHTGWVWKIAYSPDGKKLASAGFQDKSFRIWDTATGKMLIEGKDAHDGSVVGVAFSPDGKTLLTSGRDLSVKLWDVEKGTPIRKYLGAGDNVEAIAFSPDGKRFLAGETRVVHVFDTETGKIVHRFEDHTDEVLAVAFLPDGRRAVSGGKDNVIRLWGIPK